jgi:hypothetical protein
MSRWLCPISDASPPLSIRVEHKHTVGSTLVLLTLDGTHVARVEGVDADNTHLRITGRDLPVCRPHVVRREDHPGDRDVHTPGLQDHGVAHIGHVREGARCHCLARTNKVTVMQRSARIVD